MYLCHNLVSKIFWVVIKKSKTKAVSDTQDSWFSSVIHQNIFLKAITDLDMKSRICLLSPSVWHLYLSPPVIHVWTDWGCSLWKTETMFDKPDPRKHHISVIITHNMPKYHCFIRQWWKLMDTYIQYMTVQYKKILYFLKQSYC